LPTLETPASFFAEAGSGVSLRPPKKVTTELKSLLRRNLITEYFGRSEGAAFMRRAVADGLTTTRALERLRKEMFKFRNMKDLEAVAAELMRSERAGAVVSRGLPWRVLRRRIRGG
jgi:hypothetical protein